MGLRVALVDRAQLRRLATDSRRTGDGRMLRSPTWGPEIRARLSKNTSGKRREEGRPVTDDRPTLTLYKRDAEGNAVDPRLTDRIRVTSRELGDHTYEIDGEPQPIRKKQRVLGWTLTVKRLVEKPNEEP